MRRLLILRGGALGDFLVDPCSMCLVQDEAVGAVPLVVVRESMFFEVGNNAHVPGLYDYFGYQEGFSIYRGL